MSGNPSLRLVLRADADGALGAGHVMRVATLAEAWHRLEGQAVLAGDVRLPFVKEHLAAMGVPVVGEEETGDVLVVDSYDAAVRARGAARRDFRRRVLVDDAGALPGPGYDAVWNPHPFGHAGLYPGFAGPVITGAQHLPVRQDLPAWTGGAGGGTVVSLGGGILPSGLQAAMGRLARRHPEGEFAMAGDWVPRGWGRIQPASLWPAVAGAARLVVAAGTATWEAATVGVPVVVVKVAENQRLVFQWAREAGVPGADATVLDPGYLADRIAELLPVARPLPAVRGGADRVAAELAALALGEMP